ncbi:UTRA domain-containing protein [Streptomyces sp. AV19]|uniref:GntR family transcriptional regulator n=1 Tax=Streptomyces sp. AV19 TaxID=2793068 RepID=UPI0018FEEA07|nr:UTRA domain-containing protein [Streptomyces sp. AV19]MBH1934688.1 UTRA domain-containing protein [Streptomyces sp. AV19]MDG4530774.1 UTRA domain-containing protein [Streptomyces sp. AV19]
MSSSEWISTSVPYLAPRESGQPDAWSEESAARGRRGSQRIVAAGETVPAPEVARLLGTSDGESVVVRRRIIYLDDEPTELTDTYYPLDIARGTPLAGTAKIPGGAVTLLARLGYVGERVTEEIRARRPAAEELQTLAMAEEEPVLRLTRVTFDGNDRPLQVDVMTMPAHRQSLRYELRIG